MGGSYAVSLGSTLPRAPGIQRPYVRNDIQLLQDVHDLGGREIDMLGSTVRFSGPDPVQCLSSTILGGIVVCSFMRSLY